MNLTSLSEWVQEEKESIVDENCQIEYLYIGVLKRYYFVIDSSAEDATIARTLRFESKEEFWDHMIAHTYGAEVSRLDTRLILTYDSRKTMQLAVAYLKERMYQFLVKEDPNLKKRVQGS
jgi:hypothetical protein